MGGLRTKIPWTFWTMVCAWVAISGVPFTSGFYSKDAILLAAYHHAPWIYWLGTLTAGITAFYVSRAMFLTFFGKYRGHEHHIHESPPVMTLPLAVLALLSLAGGALFNVPKFLGSVFPPLEQIEDVLHMAGSAAFGLVGIALAYLMYVAKPTMAESFASSVKALYTLVYNKYFVDEVYDATVVKPVVEGSRAVLWRGVDVGLIDRLANGIGYGARDIGGVLRLIQSGNIRSYATWVVFGSVLLIVALGIAAGGIR